MSNASPSQSNGNLKVLYANTDRSEAFVAAFTAHGVNFCHFATVDHMTDHRTVKFKSIKIVSKLSIISDIRCVHCYLQATSQIRYIR